MKGIDIDEEISYVEFSSMEDLINHATDVCRNLSLSMMELHVMNSAQISILIYQIQDVLGRDVLDRGTYLIQRISVDDYMIISCLFYYSIPVTGISSRVSHIYRI